MPRRYRTVFLHIPKTGGWWVLSSLRMSLPEGSLYAVPSERVGYVPLPLLLVHYPTIAGHFTWRHLHPVLGQCFTFTFLRDPIERALSLYYYYRRQEEAPNLDPWVARVQQSQDIDTFVDQLGERPSPWSNWQTFLLSGAHDSEGSLTSMLDAARRHLDRVDMVGVQANLAGGLQVLGRLRGWRVQTPAQRVNATPDRPKAAALRPQTLRKLHRLNQLDADLFDLAKQRWAGHQAGYDESGGNPADTANAEAQMLNESGTREIIIDNVAIDVEHGHIAVEGHSLALVDDVTIGIRITNSAGLMIFGTNTRLLGQRLSVRAGERVRAVFRLDLTLVPDTYTVTAAIHEGADHYIRCFHWIEQAGYFVRVAQQGQSFSGLLDLHAAVDVAKI